VRVAGTRTVAVQPVLVPARDAHGSAAGLGLPALVWASQLSSGHQGRGAGGKPLHPPTAEEPAGTAGGFCCFLLPRAAAASRGAWLQRCSLPGERWHAGGLHPAAREINHPLFEK